MDGARRYSRIRQEDAVSWWMGRRLDDRDGFDAVQSGSRPDSHVQVEATVQVSTYHDTAWTCHQQQPDRSAIHERQPFRKFGSKVSLVILTVWFNVACSLMTTSSHVTRYI